MTFLSDATEEVKLSTGEKDYNDIEETKNDLTPDCPGEHGLKLAIVDDVEYFSCVYCEKFIVAESEIFVCEECDNWGTCKECYNENKYFHWTHLLQICIRVLNISF